VSASPEGPLSWGAELLEAVWGVIAGLGGFLWSEYFEELRYALVLIVFGLVRAAGRTVESGQTGLKFSFGRATKLCEPGFHPLIPFLQVVRVVATRDRTVDLPQQRVTTLDGLVYDVDANLVFRVVDVRRALIEIDDLDRGMYQVLGLGVQDVLRRRERGSMHVSSDLDQALARDLAARLEPWGVEVARAGFTSIQPTERTLRVTQLAGRVAERARALAALERGSAEGSGSALRGIDRRGALGLLGHQGFPVRRTKRLQRLAYAHARMRRTRAILEEAFAEGRLRSAQLPLAWRGAYEERAYLGENLGRPGKGGTGASSLPGARSAGSPGGPGGYGGKGSNQLFSASPARAGAKDGSAARPKPR
jgi:regulator of protease activity HflC (stomatin/prohibitin superfamily)